MDMTWAAVPQTVPDLEERPEPIARFLGFGDSAMNFELRAWTTNGPEILRVSTELYTAVHKALRDAEIKIPFPHRVVQVKGGVAVPTSEEPRA